MIFCLPDPDPNCNNGYISNVIFILDKIFNSESTNSSFDETFVLCNSEDEKIFSTITMVY